MTEHLYIDAADRKKIATRWVVITLGSLHVWATMVLIAVICGAGDNGTLGAMFSTSTFGIGATLAILLLDRASDIILARFVNPAPPPAKVEETVTRTTTVSPSAAQKEQNDDT
jgi:hypothetical protein